MSKNFYTCSSVSSPTTLLRVGATPHSISYTYQLNTPLLNSDATTDVISEAINRVQFHLLHSIAQRSGLTDCILFTKERGGWRSLEAEDGRRLVPKERGSTSIVGVSLEPGDEVLEDGELCTFLEGSWEQRG